MTASASSPFRRLWPALLAASLWACSAPDTRSFEIENLLFERWLDGVPSRLEDRPLEGGRQSLIAFGLSAICRGETAAAGNLFDTAAIGRSIDRLVLIAAKANRQGSCAYEDWPDKLAFLGERFKQLLGAGDAATVLLGALLDEQIADNDRQAVIDALAARGYGHAMVFQAQRLLKAGQAVQAQELLSKAAAQGAMPAHLLLARLAREGRLGKPDAAAACEHLRAAAKAGSRRAPQELASCPAA